MTDHACRRPLHSIHELDEIEMVFWSTYRYDFWSIPGRNWKFPIPHLKRQLTAAICIIPNASSRPLCTHRSRPSTSTENDGSSDSETGFCELLKGLMKCWMANTFSGE